MSAQTFPNALPERIAADYDPPLLHDEQLALLTPNQRQQARDEAENTVRESKILLRL